MQFTRKPVSMIIKRLFDVALSFLGLVVSLPLWLIIPAAIKAEDGGPVFYVQERVGKAKRFFKLIKFRSMVVDAEKETGAVQATCDDPRVHKVGRLLRVTAMDELPQLVNILKGDMSFVGPRALRPEEREVFGNPGTLAIDQIPGHDRRLAVTPGLTGLAQVYLSADAPRRKKFRADLLYIRRQSFCLDLKLIVLSFLITFRGKWEYHGKKV